LIKDLRKKLTEKPDEMGFDSDKYAMSDVAGILAKFLGEECNKLDPALKASITVGFLLGGYSKPGDLGESWSVEITKGVPSPPKELRKPDIPAISWGGQTEALQRMLVGFSPRLFDVLAKITNPPQDPKAMASQLQPMLITQLQAPMVFAPMPIQDAIDLARFLVHASIMFARFSPGPNIVGGPIEIAAITKHEQFKWISRKHYYEQPLNKEPIHVICDQ
jgi:hypothetical protein